MQPPESNQLAAVNSRQTLQGTDMDIKELATLTAAEMDDIYLRNVPAIVLEQYATRLIAASQAREVKVREALVDYDNQASEYDGRTSKELGDRIKSLLALPTDDSALMERLKEERERICGLYSPDDTAGDFMDKIRGLA